jgi:PAS domain S-box-containing protein
MHRLLQSQFKRLLGIRTPGEIDSVLGELTALAGRDDISPAASNFLARISPLFERIGGSYEQFDRDIDLRSRSLQLSSQELAEANERQRREAVTQALAIRSLRETANSLLRAEGRPELGNDGNSLGRLSELMASLMEERAIAQHELELQKFALDQHAIVSITDNRGIIVYANDKFCQISGFARGELLGQNHRIVNSGLHPPAFFDEMWHAITAGKVWHGEICNRSKSGDLYWVAATIVPQADTEGLSTFYIAIRTDITLQKAMEADLLESRRFLQSITDAMGEGVFSLDEQGRCTFLNPEAERLLGWSLADLEGVSFHESVHYEDEHGQRVAKEDCPVLAQVRRGEVYRSESDHFIRRDGTVFPISITSVPLREAGQLTGSVAVFQDITERQRILHALQESEGRLKIALEASGIGLWDWNPNTNHVFFSDLWLGMLGYRTGELPGTSDTWLSLMHPDDRACVMERLDAHKDGRDPLYEVEFRMRHKSGAWVWILSTGKITRRDEAGEPLRMTGIHMDISDRKRAEGELARAKEEADRANRLKSDFLANMSHEIRTPMNAVIGLSHLALQTGLTDRQHDYMTKIQTASRSLLGIINDILDFSKIEAGKLSLELIPFDIGAVLQEVTSVVQPKVREKGIELVVDLAPAVPDRLIGDPLRIGQILLNLVSNAVKFTERGEVVVKVGGSVRPDGLFMLEVSVRDTGIGMSAEQTAVLFRPFTQADSSMTRRFGGTGLGLAICRQLVELMGGEVRVDSRLGEGSTFGFTTACRIAASEAANGRLASDRLAGKRVLVVDDSTAVRSILTDMLERFGLEVESAAGGWPALTRLESTRIGAAPAIDLVVLDWRMPDLDGVDTLCRMRAIPGPHPPVIMATAYGGDGVQEALGDNVVAAVLEKPITPSTLLDAVFQALGGPATARPGARQPRDGATAPGDHATLVGARVLLVEDNAINQQVACELLELVGVETTVAGSGEDALALLATGAAFDAVLMDVQMPGLDGYETTESVRRDIGLTELPVIAMTAHTMAGDRERALDAGMNDHVAKPIDPPALYAALVRWVAPSSHSLGRSLGHSLGHSLGARTGQCRPAARPDSAAPALPASLPGIDLAVARRNVTGNVALLRRILLDFAADHHDEAMLLHAAASEGRWRDVNRIAHTLKGTASTIGALEVAMLAGVVEQAASTGGRFLPDDVLPRLATALAEVVDGAAILATDAPPPVGAVARPEPGTVRRARDLAGPLAAALAEGDPAAADLAESLAALLAASPAAGAAAAVARHAGSFDFEDASMALAPLRHTLDGWLETPADDQETDR